MTKTAQNNPLPDHSVPNSGSRVKQGRGFFAASGVAAGKQFSIGVVREAFEDGGQGLHHLLQLGGVLGFAGEVFLFTGIASEVIELVGLEGGLVGLTGARDAAVQAGQLPEPRNGSSIDRKDRRAYKAWRVEKGGS